MGVRLADLAMLCLRSLVPSDDFRAHFHSPVFENVSKSRLQNHKTGLCRFENRTIRK